MGAGVVRRRRGGGRAMRLALSDVSAVLVTKGDVDLQPIIDTLPYRDVHVWNNAAAPFDAKTFGRWLCAFNAPNRVWYFQDDDVIFRDHAALLKAHRAGLATLNMPPPWYERVQESWRPTGTGLGMFGGGALVPHYLARAAFAPYLAQYPSDALFLELCDLVAGTFIPWRRVDLGFEILPQATAPDRIARSPGHAERRAEMLKRVRKLVRERKRAERAGVVAA